MTPWGLFPRGQGKRYVRPLRRIVRSYVADGRRRLTEVLECGHEQLRKTNINAHARRCRACPKEERSY